jgi:hypothetical protein
MAQALRIVILARPVALATPYSFIRVNSSNLKEHQKRRIIAEEGMYPLDLLFIQYQRFGQGYYYPCLTSQAVKQDSE